MGGNGETWGEMREKWGSSGHSTWNVGCGGLWRDVVEENGIKMGEKWKENGTKYPFFTVAFPPLFFWKSKIFPTVPFGKISSPHSLTEKWEFWPLTDTHRYGG